MSDEQATASDASKASVESAAPKPRRVTRLGLAGLIVGLVALVAAVMSSWVVELLEPERQPIEHVAAEIASSLAGRLAARARGEQYVPPPAVVQAGTDWSRIYPAAVVGAGILAACVGVVGFVRRDDLRVAGATIGVGLSAVLFQYFLLLAGAVLFILLIAVVLAAMQSVV